MDESLKARLVGAVVLVLLAVLLIPELLSGRKVVEAPVEDGTGPRGTRTFTIELGGGSRPADVRETPAPVAMPAPRPAAEATPTEPQQEEAVAASTPAAASTASTPAPARAEAGSSAASAPPEQPPPTKEPPPKAAGSAPAASNDAWFVQVGAFGTAEAAGRLVRDLKGDGFPALVVPVTRGGRTLHRVRVGPAPDKAGADQLAVRLKARGLPAAVVQND